MLLKLHQIHDLNTHLPSKNSEGDRENQGLNSDPGRESVKGSIIGVSISRLSDGEPSILRIELSEAQRLPDRAS